MTDLILHHFERSPYGEKVRLAFGLKGLSWKSVIIPRQLPKPDLMPLTGGYRRTPVMQIGADVYCDTAIILREIERRHPSPTLYPGGNEALVRAVSWWAEKAMLFSGTALSASFIDFPPEFVADRKAMTGIDFSRTSMLPMRPVHRQRLHSHLTSIEMMLADGRDFLLGPSASAADLAAYPPIWTVGSNAGTEAQSLLPVDRLRPWLDRVAALGHGSRSDMSTTEALEIAAAATPEPARPVSAAEPSCPSPGDAVSVRANDYGGDPVSGSLVYVDAHEIVIRREDPRGGTIHLHVPRAGFDLLRQ